MGVPSSVDLDRRQDGNRADSETLSLQPERADDNTLSLDGGAGPVPDPDAPPVTGWDRYELLERLGHGGMGSVYRARDRRLGRTLAIKFLHGADPVLVLRFLREARAQARIDHPHVCRVYEVGEVQGRSYIALQLIDGEPLHVAAARMSLDEKIAVMRDAAGAIHEAHRLGIVHRDIKPANIMVERTESGQWFPVVMDFGLAREVTAQTGLTETGALLGTPAYMAPEQARGDVHAVDRRSDVYSLGATLYELLTGRPPFSGTLAEVLARVLDDDPAAPRSVVPSLPFDLETIVLKCLAKDPTLRYASANALADDLGRYLDGEPVVGRRLSLRQRLRQRVRRHRALFVLGAWSLAICVAAAGLAVRGWVISRHERERAESAAVLAEQLGREATEIEGDLRDAYQWPLHNTGADRARVRDRMAAIAATHHDLASLGDAIVHDALGRGHLALHDWREAADELERAAAAGRQTPELHAARGRALGELYRRAFDETRPRGDTPADKAWLARRRQELADLYLAPALAELAQIRASGDAASLLEARIALYRGDFVPAERTALEVAAHSPGQSEARTLAGDAAYSAGVEALDHGKYDAARPALERAIKVYAEASDIARSDASVYEAAAQAWLQLADVDFRQARSQGESLERALDLLDNRALRADPNDAATYTLKSDVLLAWSRMPTVAREGDQRPLLDRITETAARAVALDPRSPHAWRALGNVHINRGRYESSQGKPGAPWFERARDDYRKALELQPNDPRAISDLGAADYWLGRSHAAAGLDPMPDYQAALDSFARAAQIDPQYVYACSKQVLVHVSIAEYVDAVGDDPRPVVEAARQVGERCLAIDPGLYSMLDYLAQAQLVLAHYLGVHGDPTAALASARAYLDRCEKGQFGGMTLWYHRLVAASAEARYRLHRGEDPGPAIAQARAAQREALRRYPASAESYVEAARLDLVEAAWEPGPARGAATILATALPDVEKAIALGGKSAPALITLAEVCLQLAKLQPARAIVDRGIDAAEQALRINPRLVEAQAVHAELLRHRS